MKNQGTPLSAALSAAGNRPDEKADPKEKKNYAQRLSQALARTVADGLRADFPSITPTSAGAGQERAVGGGGGRKRVDVAVTDPSLGLILGVSIKTYSFRDTHGAERRLGRYTRNIVRNDHELRGEAVVLHQRQPYAVLIATMFEPFGTCEDGGDAGRMSDTGRSSFAHHVATLSKRTGRGRRPVFGTSAGAWVEYGAEDQRYDLFERVFIGLYGSDGDVRFFDAERNAPRHGPPAESETYSFAEYLAVIRSDVARRNQLAPAWTDDEDA